MFTWHARDFALMLAPLRADATHAQRFIRADIRVDERVTPSYALVFTVSLLDESPRPQVQLSVTKQMMARVFERVVTRGDNRLLALRTRKLEKKVVFDDAIDAVVLAWIKGSNGSRAPTREQLSRWLLSRLFLLKHDAEGWQLMLCGDRVADESITMSDEEGRATEMTDVDSEEEDEEEQRPYSPPPPSYSVSGSCRERASSDLSESAECLDDGGDEGAVYEKDEVDSSHKDPSNRVNRSVSVENVPTTSTRKLSPRSTSQLSISGIAERPPSRYQFEPATVRRHSFATMPTPTNAWTEERNQLQLKLTLSKRDIEHTQARQRKAEAIASLRHHQIIQQSQRKLVAHEQRLRDSRFVKQGIADMLEYHDITHRLQSQVKQTKIAASREQERLVQTMRIALGRSNDKWIKGPMLGPGPLSQIEIDLLTSDQVKKTSGSMWVYDLHGRRHSESEVGAIASTNIFDAAMTKIQRLLDRKTADSVDLFRQYDSNRNGTLDHSEFENLLVENGVHLTKEQLTTLFNHFDPNCSGAINYGELLWGFFNRHAFMKRWRQRKTKLSAREIKLMFFKYDRVGRGALALKDFQSALDDIGFRVSESEAKLLCLRFDTDKDGFIDYNEFHAFVHEDGTDDPQQSKSSRSAARSSQSRTVVASASGASDVDRILTELRALNETQQKISRAVARAQQW